MVALGASVFLLSLLATLVDGAPLPPRRVRPRTACASTSTGTTSSPTPRPSSPSSTFSPPRSTTPTISTSSARSTTITLPTSTSHASSTSSITTSITTSRSSSSVTARLTTSRVTTTTTVSSTSASATHSPAPSAGPVVAAYYSDWAADIITPEEVDFTRLNWVDFAFALPDQNFNLYFTEDDSESLLQRLVTAAHAKGAGVKLSVGGWTGSAYFSDAVSTAANRETLAQNMLAAYNQYDLDGIDIDWEYPGIAAASPDNGASPQDSANFLTFLQLLRSTLPAGAVISAAVQDWPFQGADGSPMTDVSGFGSVLDWITIMNYDVFGSSSTPGPNAPLSDACGDSTQPSANAVSAVQAWTAAGFPAGKIVLGVPSYGYVSGSTATQLLDRRGAGKGGKGLSVESDAGSTSSGQVLFQELVQQGALVLNGTEWVGAGGFVKNWDDCSATPWLRSQAAQQIITYDDPDSLLVKAQYSLSAGLRGVNMFDASGDTTSWVLVDALRQGLGLT